MELTEKQQSVLNQMKAGYCFTNSIGIAGKLGVSRQRVSLVLQQLKRRGLVQVRFGRYWERLPSNDKISGDCHGKETR